jgi:hypothetical protein
MSDNKEQLALMRNALGKLLLEEQERMAPHAIVNKDPERWLNAATMFLHGAGVFEVREKFNLHNDASRRINGLVKTSDECKLFMRERAMSLANTIEDISLIGDKIAATFLDGSEAAQAKIDAAETKDLTNLALAQEKLYRTFSNVTGNNVQKIEVRHITTPEEAQDLINSLPEADVEEVTDI